MRGEPDRQETMLSLWTPEQRVPQDHPLRKIKTLADRELKRLSPVFDAMYSTTGRPSVPPERVLKALLLMALYSIRSERQLCEQLDYNLLFRWFLDMNQIEESFDATVNFHGEKRSNETHQSTTDPESRLYRKRVRVRRRSFTMGAMR